MNTTTPSHRTDKLATRRPARGHTRTAVVAAGIISLGGLGAGVIGTVVVHSTGSSSGAGNDPAITAVEGDFSVAFGSGAAAALTPPVNPYVTDFSVAFGPNISAALSPPVNPYVTDFSVAFGPNIAAALSPPVNP